MALTRFQKQDLVNTIEGNYDTTIKVTEEQFEREHRGTPAERRLAWRQEQTLRVVELSERLIKHAGHPEHPDYVPDRELSQFRTKSEPYDYYDASDHARHRKEIERLHLAKKKAMAYAKALAEVEPGVVEVGAADLRRIGYEA